MISLEIMYYVYNILYWTDRKWKVIIPQKMEMEIAKIIPKISDN